jgi:hypothetical protein
MYQVPSKRHCPLKTNNHANGVDTEFSKQPNDHFAKGTSSSVCRISKMKFVGKNLQLKKVWWKQQGRVPRPWWSPLIAFNR